MIVGRRDEADEAACGRLALLWLRRGGRRLGHCVRFVVREEIRSSMIEQLKNEKCLLLRISPIPGPPKTRISSLEEPPLSLMGMT